MVKMSFKAQNVKNKTTLDNIAHIFDNGQVCQASLVLLPNQSVSIYKIVVFGVF